MSADESIGRIISMIDLTDLSDNCSPIDVEALCVRAERVGCAAVCIWPDFVAGAAARLEGSAVRVATVANFPSGDERAFATGVVIERSLADGADEIDIVLPYRTWLAGDTDRAAAVLSTARELTAGSGVLLKVILETGELPADQVLVAARFAIDCGADFVKTSTGETAVSATTEAVAAMLEAVASVSRPVGIKPSGGIGTLSDAMAYLDLVDSAWGRDRVTAERFRFGASRLLDDLESRL